MKLTFPAPKWPKIYYNFAEQRFELPSGGPDRHVYCPEDEYVLLTDVLTGKEYPLADSIIALCQGLPVIDLGANVGTASVYFEEWLTPEQLIAFEPGERARAYLTRNVPNAEVWPHAVLGYSGTCSYYDNGATVMGTVSNVPKHQGGYELQTYNGDGEMVSSTVTDIQTQTVRCLAARDVLGMITGEIGVLKLDVEGAEYDILRGARSELSKVRVIYLEYHNDFLRRKCDSVLDDFVMFHAKSDWLQGVVGYVNAKYARFVKGDL